MKFQPIGICWNITPRCVYNCRFCYAKKDEHNELGPGDCKVLIDRLHQEGVKYLSFGGGEPLLKKGIQQLIIHARGLGMFTYLCTNTKLLTRRFIEEVEQYLDQISVPLDGASNDILSKIRGTTNHLSFFYNAINIISETNINARINTLVCNYNKNDLTNIFNILNGIRNIQEWKLIRYYHVNNYHDDFALSLPDFKRFIADVVKTKVDFKISPRYQADSYQRSFILLDCIGNIYTTANHQHYVVGNIFKDRLTHALSKTEYFDKKRHIEKYKAFLVQHEKIKKGP